MTRTRRALWCFRRETAVGGDNFAPLWLEWLSDNVIEEIIDLFTEVERIGQWPTQLHIALMHLIPKTDGGRRPIGVMPTMIRWWEKVRAEDVGPWREKNERSYNWACRGRCAEDAVWRTTILDEVARARGWSSAATLLDLAKAFEHIPLQCVWQQGIKRGFPAVVLRLVLQSCAFPRRLLYRGAYSAVTSSLTAVVAGLTFATDCLYLIMIDVLDTVAAAHPTVDLGLYVDDVRLHRIGWRTTWRGTLGEPRNSVCAC